ncbi:uncharacterized protein LOC134869482 isoform X2 [Eleginops maclovinus]|uniref:uncharacterized protein LOC134869482 isoform X2 n=1 Tax=Eleginops maclovinus TaxID=56733 RepID=UPI0030802301
MVNNIMSKPLGLVLILTAHMVFSGPSPANVTGNLGDNITLEFLFNVSVTQSITVHKKTETTHVEQKIAGYSNGKSEGNLTVFPKNMSVCLEITNLNQKHEGLYKASLFGPSYITKDSKWIQLIVKENYRSSSVSPKTTTNPSNELSGSTWLASEFVTVFVVSSVVLLAAVLPLLIWFLLTNKDKQPETPQQSSNPTAQETVGESSGVPAPPLVYSVLDFPKRTSAVIEMNSSETEYAAISYLPDKRQG